MYARKYKEGVGIFIKVSNKRPNQQSAMVAYCRDTQILLNRLHKYESEGVYIDIQHVQKLIVRYIKQTIRKELVRRSNDC